MTRVVFLSSVLLVLLAAALPCGAQAPADDDFGYVAPSDQLFRMPSDVTWLHNIIAFWWLVPMIGLSGLLLWVVKWIDHDAQRLKIDPASRNIEGIVASVACLAAFVGLPWWLSLPAAAAAIVVMLRSYIPVRNARVIPERQLLTAEHRQVLKTRFMKWLGMRPASAEKRLEKIAMTHVPVALYDERGRLLAPADAPFLEDDPLTTVREILGEAVRRHAREVELAPQGGAVAVSSVIDGFLYSGTRLDRVHGGAVMTAVKRALIDPSSTTPQFRALLPTLNRAVAVKALFYGEGDVELLRLRLVPDDETLRKIGELGLLSEQERALRSGLDTGRGLIVVSSAPGAGARTTLRAFLDTMDPFSRSIVTFERPIAGSVASVEQHEFSDPAALAGRVEEALRKDPNVVMLSEIPDAATAEIALGAIPRDQLFLARLELPGAANVPGELVRRGASPAAVARGLHTVVAQMLVRRVCAACRVKTAPPAAVLERAHVDPATVDAVYEESTGCDACGHTGFHGRLGVFEVWSPSAESRRLIEQNASAEALHAAALRDGMKSLQQSGLALVLEGVTSLREVARALKAARTA